MAPRGRSTATKANALSREELDEFLLGTYSMTLATERDDGYCHVTPLWYLWEDGVVLFTLVEGRRHLKNLRRTARATVCVSQDERAEIGPAGAARAAMLCGPVELRGPIVVTPGDTEVLPTLRKVARRYLGSDSDRIVDGGIGEDSTPRTLVILKPEVRLTFDLTRPAEETGAGR